MILVICVYCIVAYPALIDALFLRMECVGLGLRSAAAWIRPRGGDNFERLTNAPTHPGQSRVSTSRCLSSQNFQFVHGPPRRGHRHNDPQEMSRMYLSVVCFTQYLPLQ